MSGDPLSAGLPCGGAAMAVQHNAARVPPSVVLAPCTEPARVAEVGIRHCAAGFDAVVAAAVPHGVPAHWHRRRITISDGITHVAQFEANARLAAALTCCFDDTQHAVMGRKQAFWPSSRRLGVHRPGKPCATIHKQRTFERPTLAKRSLARRLCAQTEVRRPRRQIDLQPFAKAPASFRAAASTG